MRTSHLTHVLQCYLVRVTLYWVVHPGDQRLEWPANPNEQKLRSIGTHIVLRSSFAKCGCLSAAAYHNLSRLAAQAAVCHVVLNYDQRTSNLLACLLVLWS